MTSTVVIKATRRDAPMCEGAERLESPLEGYLVARAMNPRPGFRWIVRSCGACSGYHVVPQPEKERRHA